MAATYITVTNATTTQLSLVGDNGKPRIDIQPTAGSNTANIDMDDLLGNALLCSTLSTWTTSGNITSVRGSVTLTAADFTAWATGADMNRSDYDTDDDTIIDTAESIMVNNPTAVAFAASPYTVLSTDTVLLVDTSAGAVEVDLPAVASSSGRTIVIKDEGGVAGTSAITIDPNAAETLDGSATSATITTNFGWMSIFCDGTQWLSNSKSKAHDAEVLQIDSPTTVNFAATPYAVLVTDTLLLVDTTAGVVEIDLPAVASNAGRTLTIKDEGGVAGTNQINIDPNAAETLDGSAVTATITTNFGYMGLYCDGTQWLTQSSSTLAASAQAVANWAGSTTAVNFAASPYAGLATDEVLLVDVSGGAVAITLPPPVARKTIKVVDTTGGAGTNNITVSQNAAETIDGLTAIVMRSNYEVLTLISDGTNWFSYEALVRANTAGFLGSTTAVNFAASPYAGLATDEVLLVDVSGGAVAITLPPPVARKTIKFLDTTGGAGTNNITVSQNAAETIDGATSIVMASNYEVLTLISDGTNWFSSEAILRATEDQSVLNEAAGIHVVTRAVGHADLTASAGNQSFDFAAALPADAWILGSYIDITEGFTDGVAGVFTADLGESGGTTDALIDGADIASIAKVGTPLGSLPTGFTYAGDTLAIDILATVDVDTATAGALTVKVAYINMDSLLTP